MCQLDDEIDYESIPNSSVQINMLAGALAGITEHVVIYPLDVLKTRLQLMSAPALKMSLLDSLSKLYTTEGMAAMWRGVNSVLLGAGPAHALYFGTYEIFKSQFKTYDNSEHNHLSHAGAGVFATLAHDALLTPFDGNSLIKKVVKQRMQLSRSSDGLVKTTTTMLSNEGWRSFYVSFPVTFMMSVPFQVAQFTTYEYTRKKLNPSGQYNPFAHSVAGGLAGAVASAITNPLDVAKTLLQTRGLATDSALRHASNLSQAFKIIYGREGLHGFTRGLQARILAHVPSTALSWTTYEFMKMTLQKF